MPYLNLKTEYSYRYAFGRIKNVIEKLNYLNIKSAGICDRNGTWGHVPWEKQCKKNDIKPIFGVEIGVVKDSKLREKQTFNFMTFIAANNNGLEQVYNLTTQASSPDNFYYSPRIDYSELNELTNDVFVFTGQNPDWEALPSLDSLFLNACPMTRIATLEEAKERNIKIVATNENFYIDPQNHGVYEIAIGRFKTKKTTPMHIINADEFLHYHNDKRFIENSESIAEQCNVQLPKATMVSFPYKKTLRQLCEQRAPHKNIDLSKDVYKERLDKELSLIKSKNFEDYFYVIWDMVKYAKQHMLVGPARGSSCGSLVCYLLDITEIDPIPHGLIFERFIDINRNDMPDIDIDFPDTKRDKIFEYLKEKYGEQKVAKLGSVNKFKPKSAINIAAKELNIPPWQVKDFKNSIIERPEGDARFDCCIHDAFKESEIAQKTLDRYPYLSVCENLESHASHAGQHAGGVIVTNSPINKYCAIDLQTNCAEIDKRDAEYLDLLKIDVLGIKTLAIIESCLDQINWTKEKLFNYRINDNSAFNVINEGRFSGVFQFDGNTVKSICEQIKITKFEDIAAITAIARPGPLDSGGAQQYCDHKNGHLQIQYLHPSLEPILNETYGVIVYQEQVMKIVKDIGQFSWADTSAVRKAISKSLGAEILDKYKQQFVEGAFKSNKIEEPIAINIFNNICKFGSYGFNKSHAVAYALLSYWCMVLKAKHPLAWAVSCLQHQGSGTDAEEKSIKILRELDNEGIKYKPFDPESSLVDWSYSNGLIIGGLTNIKGVGAKVAGDIIKRRENNKELTPRQKKLLTEGKTPYDYLYEGKEIFGDVLLQPHNYNIVSHIWPLNEIDEGEFLVMAKLLDVSIRDENELVNIQKRKNRAAERGEDIGNGKIYGQTLYLNCKIEDDSGKTFYARIGRMDYKKLGVAILDRYKKGDWFLWKGNKIHGIDMLFVSRYRFIGNKESGCIL